jgi:hypothetical protein
MAEKLKIQEITEKSRSIAETLLLKKVEGISSLAMEGSEWKVEVEILERKSIPDTQDILSKYELKFDEIGELTGYRRIGLRHRGDMEVVEEEV